MNIAYLPRLSSSVTFCVLLAVSQAFIGIGWMAILNKVNVYVIKDRFIELCQDTKTLDSSWSMVTSTPAMGKYCQKDEGNFMSLIHVSTVSVNVLICALIHLWFWDFICVKK